MLKYLREGRLENETGVCKCEVHEQREVKTPLSSPPIEQVTRDSHQNRSIYEQLNDDPSSPIIYLSF